ncbi:MAG: M24 family metallopeptidase [Anaerolineales bacterium]|nr:M24 family metallopeptidase [Anaerolineales bacterium]
MNEFEIKQERLHQLLDARGLDAIVLQRVSSFAWATCGGASYINTAVTFGAATLVITRRARYLLTNNIEAGRLLAEEGLAGQGWEPHVHEWHSPQDALAQLTHGLKVGADSPLVPGAVDLNGDLARLRAALTPEEGERFRVLGRLCAQAMNAAIRAVHPGQTEHEIAALLAHETQRRGVQPIVNLIATDERLFRYRHPLPTEKVLERYAMLVLCGRWKGLVCSLTRLVHFGLLPGDVRRKAEAVAAVDAAYLAATRPGATLGEIFRCGQRAYAEAGFADEWRFHHQGGAAGYEPREYLGTPDSAEVVAVGQVFAWNPSIVGTKSEDTFLVGEAGNEVLTAMEGWPQLENGRPAILEVT